MPQRCLEQGFVRAVICRNAASGQATASFGGDTEVALAIGADGPRDLRLSEQQLIVAGKKNAHIYYQVWRRPHPDAAS